jgi:hypothetical protein
MSKISFIASRYKENESDDIEKCVKTFFKKHETKVIFYDKFSKKNSTYKLVPNLGREAYAWFDYVINTWEHPDDYYAFIHPCSNLERQDKYLKLINLCQHLSNLIESNNNGYCLTDKQFTIGVNPEYNRKIHWQGFTPSNIKDVKEQEFLPTTFVNLGEWWEQKTKRFGKLNLLPRAPAHGFCAASKNNIQSWGIDFWKEIFDDIIKGGPNGEIAHFIERSMISIVAGKDEIINFTNLNFK